LYITIFVLFLNKNVYVFDIYSYCLYIIINYYRCEKALMASVNVKNCVKFYTTADEIGADTLKEHCSSLISAHWVSLSKKKFSSVQCKLILL